MNETMNVILHRRSIRAYKPDQISDGELETILDAGKHAASGNNGQPWHFTVVQEKDLLKQLQEFTTNFFLHSDDPAVVQRAQAEGYSAFYHAPTVIIVSGNTSALTYVYDCTLAMGNMFLAASSLNVGSCWCWAIPLLFDTPYDAVLREELKIPSGYKPVAAGDFGYLAGVLPSALPRKENTVTVFK
jgi:nitroreductase